MMKKFLSIIVFSALALNLCVPIFAGSADLDFQVGISYTTDSNNNTCIIDKSIEEDGGQKVIVSGANGVCEAIRYGDILYFTWTPHFGSVRTWSVNLSKQQKQSISPRAIQEIGGLAWGFSCKANDSKKDTQGIFWTLYSEEGGYVAFDQKNLTYRGYAEAFWDDIISMNAAIRDAKIAMSEADLKNVQSLISALSGIEAVYEAVVAALESVHCSYASAEYWQTAREYANQANYYFLRFRDATEDNTNSLLIPIL